MTLLDGFVQERDSAAESAEDLAEALSEFCPDAARSLGGAARRVRKGRFRVLLLGSFSTGKSTLLNAMLGCRVMPAKVNPCTALRTEIVWGEKPHVEVHHTDGTSIHIEPQDFASTWQLDPEDAAEAGAVCEDRFSHIDHARVFWPLPLLQNGVILTDTSGLDDDPARTARTLQSLPDADAVIVVLSALRFLTHVERQTLHRDLLPLGLKNLFFVVTMVDLIEAISEQPERDLKRLKDRARETLGPLCVDQGRDVFGDRVFWVNARGALGARASHKTGLPRKRPHSRVLRESGLSDFERAFQTFLIRDRGQAQVMHLNSVQDRAREALLEQAQIRRQTFQTTVAQLQRRHEELQPRLGALVGMSDRVGDTVDAFIERQQALIWQDLRTHLGRAEVEVPEALEDFDLGPLASLDLWAPQGRERVEAALSAHLEDWLAGRIESWQRELQPRVIAALDQLRAELAVETAQFDALAQEIVADFVGGTIEAPRPRSQTPEFDPLERWFSVAVGALLLSPGTVAAAWTDGYEGALRGAASRIGVRLAVVSLGALLGPLGGSAIALYALSDAALLGWTGEGRIRRLRSEIAHGLRGQLVAQADASKEAIYAQVRDSLSPLRQAIVDAVRDEAEALQQRLQQTVDDRARVTDEAELQNQRIEALLDRFPPIA